MSIAGTRPPARPLEAVDAECVRLHFAHAHLSVEIDRGRLPELVAPFDAAIDEGVDISFDSSPSTAGMTSLHALLPGWAREGTVDDIRAGWGRT